jgi:hypothetical protein
MAAWSCGVLTSFARCATSRAPLPRDEATAAHDATRDPDRNPAAGISPFMVVTASCAAVASLAVSPRR